MTRSCEDVSREEGGRVSDREPPSPAEVLPRPGAAVLQTLLRAVGGQREAPEALRLCLDAALEVSGAETGGIFLCEGSAPLREVRSAGLSVAAAEALRRAAAASQTAAAGAPVYAGRAQPGTPDLPGAFALIPVGQERRAVACLAVASEREEELPVACRPWLEAIASVLDLVVGRLQAEEALRKFSRVLDQTASTVLITDPTGRIEYVNPRFSETTGYAAEEVLGKRPSLLKSGYTSPEEYQALWRTIQAGEDWCGEFHNRRKDGSLYWESATISPVRDELGRVTHFAAIKEDITERKRAEAAAAEQEARYRAVIETSTDGFWMLDRRGRIIAVNDAYVRRSGFSREELLTMTIGDLDAQESPAEVRAHIEKVKRQEGDLFESRHRTKNGEIWPVEVNASYSEPAGGLFFAFTRDITMRKAAETALRDSEERYRNLFMHSPDCILVNREERVTLVNEACVALFGAPSAEALIGKSPFDLIHRDLHPLLRERMRRLCDRGEPGAPIEEKAVRFDGSTVDVEAIAVPFPVDGASAIHVILRDITERKALEREIIEVSTAEQERIGQDIHDGLGQQLTGASMLAAGVERRLLASGQEEEARALHELRDLLRTTLEHARSLARGLSPVEIDPEGLADALSALAAGVTRSAGINCRYRGSRAVQVNDAVVAMHLYRIAQEAVHNAVRHGRPRTIDIRLESAAGALELAVRDDGRGIDLSQERRDRLGLQVMRYRANILRGRFSVGPVAGGGTLVRCEVPLAP